MGGGKAAVASGRDDLETVGGWPSEGAADDGASSATTGSPIVYYVKER